MPWEVEAEMNEGKLPDEIDKKHRQMAIDMGLSCMDIPKIFGGKELSIIEQVAVWEVLGRSTNALTWCFSEPQAWMLEALQCMNKLKNTFYHSWTGVGMNVMQ